MRNIASELEDEKVKFPTRAFKNWLNMVESSRDPEEYCEGILSVKKLSVGDLISIFEENQNTLIKKSEVLDLLHMKKLCRSSKKKQLIKE